MINVLGEIEMQSNSWSSLLSDQVRRTNKSLDKSSIERCREQEGRQVIRKAMWSEGLSA